MSNYPEWQSKARQAAEEFDRLEQLKKKEENEKRNAEISQALREFLSGAGIDGEVVDGRFERDGYIITLGWNLQATFSHIKVPAGAEYAPYWVYLPTLWIGSVKADDIASVTGKKFEEVDRILRQIEDRDARGISRSDEENDANAEIASLVRQLVSLAQYREDY